jgi:hypothetical protein
VERAPGVQLVKVGYEKYGMQTDIEYFEERMEDEKRHFPITELAWPREGPGSKIDRIQRLEPDFRNGRILLAACARSPPRRATKPRCASAARSTASTRRRAAPTRWAARTA